jgi:hypothetical protein
MKRVALATWTLVLLLLAGCAGRSRLPECRGPFAPVNPAEEGRRHE